MEATYPYGIKNQRNARNTLLGVFRPKVPWGLWVPKLVLYGIRGLV